MDEVDEAVAVFQTMHAVERAGAEFADWVITPTSLAQFQASLAEAVAPMVDAYMDNVAEVSAIVGPGGEINVTVTYDPGR